MYRYLYIFIFVLAASALEINAQNPTPTPAVSDTQNPAPETLQGIPAIATGYRSDDRTLPDLGRIGVDMTQQRTLTLREAIEFALDNNKDIEVSRKTATIAKFDLQAARGFYQPRLTGQTFYDRSTVPNVSIFSNNQKTTQGSLAGNAALQFFAPSQGTVFSGTFNNQRLATDNPISILSPQLNTNLGFSVTQPLFRGRKFDQARRTIEIAKRNISLTDTQFQQRSIEIVAGVQRAYWDLTFALRNLQVQRDGVRDARSQLEHNRRLVDEGQLAPIDIVAAETQVANFEQGVYDALNTVNLAENLLKNLLSPNRTNAIWNEALTPVEPVEVTVPHPTLTEAMDAALENRPELEINRTQKELNLLDQKLYREQKKAQIDFVAGYTTAGIGGSQNPNFSPTFPTPCSINPASPACAQQRANLALLTGNPFSGLFANRYPVFRVGVNFNLPLFGDKTAAAQLGRSRVEAERLDTQREQVEQNIQVDVRNALQAIRTGEVRLRAAAVARENTAKQYDSEQRKLDAGQSDIYKVLDRQTALAAARSNELRARTDLNKAIADLQRATGNSLKENNVVPKLKK
ncbi:MAG: TolC family protein [Pyrinomonadaceae bacterium]